MCCLNPKITIWNWLKKNNQKRYKKTHVNFQNQQQESWDQDKQTRKKKQKTIMKSVCEEGNSETHSQLVYVKYIFLT